MIILGSKIHNLNTIFQNGQVSIHSKGLSTAVQMLLMVSSDIWGSKNPTAEGVKWSVQKTDEYIQNVANRLGFSSFEKAYTWK